MMAGERDTFPNYEKVTGRDPRNATFEEFVCHYLTSDMRKVDGHFRTQRSKLLPVKYTHAIPMSNLQSDVAELIGSNLADAYFGNKANSSGGVEYDNASSAVPCRELYQRWQDTGEVPSYKSLLTDELRRVLRDIYSDDFDLIRRVEGQ